jgi:transcriptional regulator with XRE-family HTH domain
MLTFNCKQAKFYLVLKGERTMTFGEKLKELRLNKRLTQRELADKVGLNFTYLSKIENVRMPPPSRKKIMELAEALDASPEVLDELLILAKKIPASVESMDQSKGFLQFLRVAKTNPLTEEGWEKLAENLKKSKKRPS